MGYHGQELSVSYLDDAALMLDIKSRQKEGIPALRFDSR